MNQQGLLNIFLNNYCMIFILIASTLLPSLSYSLLNFLEALCHLDLSPSIWVFSGFDDPYRIRVLVAALSQLQILLVADTILDMECDRKYLFLKHTSPLQTVIFLHILKEWFLVWKMMIAVHTVVHPVLAISKSLLQIRALTRQVFANFLLMPGCPNKMALLKTHSLADLHPPSVF